MKILIALTLTLSTHVFAQNHEQVVKQCQAQRRAWGVDTNLYGPAARNALELELSDSSFQADSTDPAGKEARRIEAIISNPNFYKTRSRVQNSHWDRSDLAYWEVQNEDDCLKRLKQMGIAFKKAKTCSPVPSPVELKSGFEFDGITFHNSKNHSFLFSCELLLRLPHLTNVLKANGVSSIAVMSDHRPGTLPGDPSKSKCGPKSSKSFHHTGLAIDISAVTLQNGQTLDLNRDYYQGLDEVEELNRPTCGRELPEQPKARTLRKIACDLYQGKIFSTVLTPNYNCGHKDHYHLDLRPRDDRVFLR